MAYRQGKEYGQTVVGAVLVLYGAAHRHVFIALAPIGGQAGGQAFDAFGKEKEGAVAALTDDFPDFFAPGVGFFNQQIGGEAQPELRA